MGGIIRTTEFDVSKLLAYPGQIMELAAPVYIKITEQSPPCSFYGEELAPIPNSIRWLCFLDALVLLEQMCRNIAKPCLSLSLSLGSSGTESPSTSHHIIKK